MASEVVEQKRGIVLFTGERVTSASARHILGEEACRVLQLLRVSDSAVKSALERAIDGLMRCLQRAALDPRNSNPGRYCCGKCTVGLWRNLLVGGLDRQEERLRKGVAHLRTMRDGEGQWRVFPFWYTVLNGLASGIPRTRVCGGIAGASSPPCADFDDNRKASPLTGHASAGSNLVCRRSM